MHDAAMQTYEADILVVGASLGGTAAALSAAEQGQRVILTEESAWVGGQLTSQGRAADML